MMPMRISFVPVLLAIAAIGMPAVRAAEPAASGEAVEQAMRGYAATLKEGNPEAVAGWYAKEGELLLPGLAPLRGPAAIRAFLVPLVGATEVESVAVTTDLVAVHGESADLWGTYHQVAGEKGKPKQGYDGRYAALWHHEADGKWRLVRLMMQPVPAEAK
jgi:uncharacterized protein (TIGR02246 family)